LLLFASRFESRLAIWQPNTTDLAGMSAANVSPNWLLVSKR
jgi:hypothetical protein